MIYEAIKFCLFCADLRLFLQEFVAVCYKLRGDITKFEFQKHKLRQEYIAAQMYTHAGSINSNSNSKIGNDLTKTIRNAQLKFIVADECALSREIITSMLKNEGHIAVECENGAVTVEEVFSSLQSGQTCFDAAFLDLFMPNMVRGIVSWYTD